MRLMLLRHGEPEGAARGRCYGELDVALSEAGRSQATRLRPRLAEEDIAAVYTSPRQRARETAELAAPQIPLHVEPALREIDFGEFEGLTYEEAERKNPQLYRQWMERPTEVTFPGGESWPLVRTRVTRFSAEVRARHENETVLIVAHGGPLRALLSEALGLPDANIFRIDQPFAGLSLIEYFDELPLVRWVNA